MGFCLAIESSQTMSTGQTALQGSSETVLDKLPTHSPNGRGAYVQRFTDLLICPTWSVWAGISFEQNPGMQQFPCRRFSFGNHALKICAFFRREFHNIFFIQVVPPVLVDVAQGYNTASQLPKWEWSSH